MRYIGKRIPIAAITLGLLLLTASCHKDDTISEKRPEYRISVIDAISGIPIQGAEISVSRCRSSNGEFGLCNDMIYVPLAVSDSNGLADINFSNWNDLKIHHAKYFDYDKYLRTFLQKSTCWEPLDELSDECFTRTMGLYPKKEVRLQIIGNKRLPSDADYTLTTISSVSGQGGIQGSCLLNLLDLNLEFHRFPANRDTMLNSFAIPGRDLIVQCSRIINYRESLTEFRFSIPVNGEVLVKFSVPD